MIEFNYETDFKLDDEALIQNWISACIETYGFNEGELNYIFCDDDYLICPLPRTIHFSVTSFSNAKGPRACSFCVEMPISAPSSNTSPSVKRVDAFEYTTAESTFRIKYSQDVMLCSAE